LFLSLQLAKHGRVIQWRSAHAHARTRTGTQPHSVAGSFRRSYTQFRESLFLQRLLNRDRLS
jgi:hypothetical protein